MSRLTQTSFCIYCLHYEVDLSTFYFVVDYPMDGVLTVDAIWVDSVNVTVH